jgi:hypothetical protein
VLGYKERRWRQNVGKYDITWQMSGVTDLVALMEGVDPWAQRRVMIETMQFALVPMLQTARSLAPSRTGALRKALGIKVKAYPGSGRLVGMVGARKSYYVIVPPKERKRGLRRTARKVKRGEKGKIRPANYLHLVELGHYSAAATGHAVHIGTKGTKIETLDNFPTRSFIRPKPFLRPAYMATKQATVARLAAGFNRAMQREYNRQIRKLTKRGVLLKAA